jgi:hypothetical protein
VKGLIAPLHILNYHHMSTEKCEDLSATQNIAEHVHIAFDFIIEHTLKYCFMCSINFICCLRE